MPTHADIATQNAITALARTGKIGDARTHALNGRSLRTLTVTHISPTRTGGRTVSVNTVVTTYNDAEHAFLSTLTRGHQLTENGGYPIEATGPRETVTPLPKTPAPDFTERRLQDAHAVAVRVAARRIKAQTR